MIRAKVKFKKGQSISVMSLVNRPAIEVDFLKLSEEDTLMLEVLTEKKEIIGPALIPNKNYYRGPDFFSSMDIDAPQGGYIYFDEETIKEISIEYLNATGISVNTDHQLKVDRDKYELMESWFVEDNNDKAYKHFNMDKVLLGTWMLHYRITDELLWKSIIEGRYNGFSMEGSPDIVVETEKTKMTIDDNYDLITDELSNIFYNLIKSNVE
ncbi:MAG: XkdF-like putative serine protease domain-containing protein [Nanoarchaeota archaeon]